LVEEVATSTGSLAFHKFSDVDISGFGVHETALTVAAVLLPVAFVDVAADLDKLALALTDKALMLPVVDVAVWVEEFADWSADAMVEGSVEDEPCVEEKSSCAMELVIIEAANVYVAIGHSHLALRAHVVAPTTFKAGPVHPGHLSLALTLSGLPVTLECGLLPFSACHSRNAVQVLHSALAARTAIFEVTLVLVSVFVVNDSLIIEFAICKGSRLCCRLSVFFLRLLRLLALLAFLVWGFFLSHLFRLEHVAIFVFKVDVSICFVLYEEAGDFCRVGLEDTALANSLVILPVTVVDVPVGVVMLARLVPRVVLEVSHIILTIGE